VRERRKTEREVEGVDLGLLVLRVVVGGLFFAHGAQKLFGWFGGHGLEGTGGFFESLGYRPGKPHASLAGLSEAGGGLLLVLGFLTPLACAAIIGVMINAIMAVHAPKGMWNTDGGMEYPLVLAAAAAGLAFTGAGTASVDGAFGWHLGGVWGFAALALGILGGLVLVSMRRPEPEIGPEAEPAIVTGRASVTGTETEIPTGRVR